MRTIHDKYASLLVNYSLELKEGDALMINSSHLAEPLLRAVYREALRAGAFPEVRAEVEGLPKIFFDEASPDQLSRVSPVMLMVMEQYDALLNISAPFNLKELQNADAAKRRDHAQAQMKINRTMLARAAKGDLRWTLCEFPTRAQAQESGMSLAELEEFVYSACLLYDEDPVASWRMVHERQQAVVDLLNGKETVRYAGRDIDITFSTKGRTWINSDGHHNMPSGEVFTSPVEDSVNGRVRFSFPGIFMGQEIEDITLEVNNGEVTRWDAAKGKDLLDRLFTIPGARRFGEVAAGTNKGITRFTKNMLFDEKMGGTIHMALGASYPETGGRNESAVHLDLLADMRGGEISADGEVIYRDGEFLI